MTNAAVLNPEIKTGSNQFALARHNLESNIDVQNERFEDLATNQIGSFHQSKNLFDDRVENQQNEERQTPGLFTKTINFFKNYAGIIDSRESLTRLILDLTAFDIPTMLVGATRNSSIFLEKCLEALSSSGNLLVAPIVTKLMAKLASKMFLGKEDQKHYYELARFHKNELYDEQGFHRGVSRILDEEPKDLFRVASLYQDVNKNKTAESIERSAVELKDYFSALSFKPDRLKSLLNYKEAILIFESFFEGGIWGSFGLILRWFRKNILKQDSFSGTKKYVNKEEAEKLGQSKPLAWWQKSIAVSGILSSPLFNFIIARRCRDREAVKKNKFLQICDKGMDMTHGLFPKLGLLASYSTLPKWIGALATVQGADEFIERALTLATVIPSWWLGHRVTNGKLAAINDTKLASKYGVERGILLEEDELDKFAPDAARIHHVLETTQGNKQLQKEARNKHASVFWGGITLHSLGVLAIQFLISKFTKWRVERKKSMMS